MTAHILVIEDEVPLAESIRDGLEAEGYAVSVSHNGEDGYFRLLNEPCDLVVLDVMLPGRDGFTVLQAVRELDVPVPVIIVTARDSIEDRVQGLDLGADDYLGKPFAFAELSARIRALLRRKDRAPAAQLQVADLHVDLTGRKVTRGDQQIDLTPTEFDLLVTLLQNKGHVVTRSMLASAVWDDSPRATPLDNVIDVHFSRLRKKIDQSFQQPLIHTVRGVGFKIQRPE